MFGGVCVRCVQEYQSVMSLRHAVWVGQRRKEKERRRDALLASAVRERRMLMEAAAKAKSEEVQLVASWLVCLGHTVFSAQESVRRRRQERWRGREQNWSDFDSRWSSIVK